MPSLGAVPSTPTILRPRALIENSTSSGLKSRGFAGASPVGATNLLVMKCRMCNKAELNRRESLFEMDAENQRIITYFTCPVCRSIYNYEGNLLIHGSNRIDIREVDV